MRVQVCSPLAGPFAGASDQGSSGEVECILLLHSHHHHRRPVLFLAFAAPTTPLSLGDSAYQDIWHPSIRWGHTLNEAVNYSGRLIVVLVQVLARKSAMLDCCVFTLTRRRSVLTVWGLYHRPVVRHHRGYTSARGSAPEEEHMIFVPHWEYPVYASERIKDRKSVFLAHASTLPSTTALPTFIKQLSALPALKRATHCMYAYRVIPEPSEPSRRTLGQQDGGERGSGERLSRLLEVLDCKNVVVVVSRWYGGVKLGSDRWKLISDVAKEALDRGGFQKEKTVDTDAPQKKNTKKKKRL